ncbi:MAG TPA: DnaJ domain-containing protein [Verrucomicrobiae bacterium]
MTDYFALLEQPRRPWLDSAAIKQRFLALSAPIHPDKLHSAPETDRVTAAKQFSNLNAAHACLSEPKSRLLHLLELETGTPPPNLQQIPNSLVELFAKVATLCKQADSFLAEKNANTSPLLAVQFFEHAQEWISRLDALKNKLGVLRQRLDDELRSLDATWMGSDTAARPKLLPEIERLYRLFSYFNRWNNQVQERIVQLAL